MRLHAVGVELVASHHPPLAVFMTGPGLVMQAANQRDLVHHASHLREVLADLNARHVGVDRRELAPYLRGSFRLHVPRIDLPRRPDEEDRDAVPNFLVRQIHSPLRFERHPSRQRQRRQPGRPRLQEAAPRRSVTRTHRNFFVANMKHGDLL